MGWTVGVNTPGYLPDAEVASFEDFADAKQHLIDEIIADADRLDLEGPTTAGSDLSLLAEEVNLWSPGTQVIVGDERAYWIQAEVS